MVLGGASLVRGEVYRIAPALEAALDRLEGVRASDDCGEYRKREVVVMVAGRPLGCLVYEIQPAEVIGHRLIPSGDWFDPAFSEKEG